jgi:predicted permease
MRSLWQDIRFGLRMMVRSPGFTATVVLCLALGIGANTAIFSLIYESLLRPLPHYKDPSRLVSIRGVREAFRNSETGASLPDLADLQHRSTCFAQLASCYRVWFTLTDEDRSRDFWGLVVSEGYFETLGVHPALGRRFFPEEYRPGGEGVVAISHELWARRFGSDPDIIGRQLTLNRKQATVVGIMPPGFVPQAHSSKTIDIYTPSVDLGAYLVHGTDRSERLHRAVARLKPNVTMARAQAEMDGICRQLAADYPASNEGYVVRLFPLNWLRVGEFRSVLWMLLAVTGLVLLITCTNLANLVLTRTSRRGREIAVRTALGAVRVRLVRQLLIEGLMLSILGGAVGLLLASWGSGLFLAFAPERVLQLGHFGISAAMLALAAGLALAASVAVGLFPALRVFVMDHRVVLKEAGRSGLEGKTSRRFRELLVIGEIALTAR